MSDTLTLHADGASRGNPGPAGAGAILHDSDGNVVAQIAQFLGNQVTNNVAEYSSLLLGVKKALELDAKILKIFMDSELVVKQIKGEYRVKNEKLIPIYSEVMRELAKLSSYEIAHVRREYNTEADQLSNIAIDQA